MPRKKSSAPLITNASKPKFSTQFVVRLSPEHGHQIDALAVKLKGSKADVLRAAYEYWIKHCADLQPVLREIAAESTQANGQSA